MPTKEQLSQSMESQFEFPSTRRQDDPMYVDPRDLHLNSHSIIENMHTAYKHSKPSAPIYPEIINFLNEHFDRTNCPNEEIRSARDMNGDYKFTLPGLAEKFAVQYVINERTIADMCSPDLKSFLRTMRDEFRMGGYNFPFEKFLK